LLGIYPLTLLLMWFSFVYLLFDTEYRWISLGVFSLVFIVKWIIQGRCFAKLKGKKFIFLLPFGEFAYALLIPILYYVSEKPKLSKWK
jgi:hypothetical protein